MTIREEIEFHLDNMSKAVLAVKVPPEDAPPFLWYGALQKVRGSNRWRRFYNKYLKSVAWSNKRVEVFEEKGVTCQLDFDCCNVIATQVHHVRYDNVGDEDLDDLMPVCEPCHMEYHSY